MEKSTEIAGVERSTEIAGAVSPADDDPGPASVDGYSGAVVVDTINVGDTGFELEFSEEPELRRWLEMRGCDGLHCVEFRAGGRRGIWLRDSVSEGDAILSIPSQAWISVLLDSEDPELELAWRLLCERWLGEASSFKPYIDFLWRVELQEHPVFWENDEVCWLAPSPGTTQCVEEFRELTGDRARILAGRALSPGSGAPRILREDPARMDAELKFALCLVETRAITGALQSQSPVAAMVPVLDGMRHDASGAPALLVGEQEGRVGGPMCAFAQRPLSAGDELLHCYDEISNGELLARYGISTSGADSMVHQFLSSNAYLSVEIPVPMHRDNLDYKGRQLYDAMLKQLALKAGLDLQSRAEPRSSRLSLPEDFIEGGRLLPTARFFTQRQELGESLAGLFKKLFKDVRRPGMDGDARLRPPRRSLPVGEELQLEMQARVLAWDWCEHALKRYERASAVLVRELGGVAQRPGDAGDHRSGDDAELRVDDIVRAHFKTKGGSKSKKAKDARVLAIMGRRAAVQFLENGMRHFIPMEWILDSPTGEDKSRSSVPLTPLRLSRGRMALALLQSEESMLEIICSRLMSFVQLGEAIAEAEREGVEAAVAELTADLAKLWEEEQDMASGFSE